MAETESSNADSPAEPLATSEIDTITDVTKLWDYIYNKCKVKMEAATQELKPVVRLSKKGKRKIDAEDSEKPKQREYPVLAITCHWFVNDRWHYEVQWEGYSKEKSSYEPSENLMNSLILIAAYYKNAFLVPPAEEVQAVIDAMDEECQEAIAEFIADPDRLHKYLEETDFSFEEDFCPKRLAATEQQISEVQRAGAECVAIMRGSKVRIPPNEEVPNDKNIIKRTKEYCTLAGIARARRQQLQKLKQYEAKIQKMEQKANNAPLTVENNRDLCVVSEETFTYITDMEMSEDVAKDYDDNPPAFCNCTESCNKKKECSCAGESGVPYTKNGLLIGSGMPVYECNKNCKCPPTCRRRVVQHGRKVPLCLFKTARCGWGVKTTRRVAKGTYLCEYIGELITGAQSNVRDVEYRQSKNMCEYMFDLDFDRGDDDNSKDAKYAVDATKKGNIARFINNGCLPNAHVVAVWVDVLDPDMQKLCIFARQELKAGEEVTFDYIPQQPQQPGKLDMIAREFCYCGAENCRGVLFTKSVTSTAD